MNTIIAGEILNNGYNRKARDKMEYLHVIISILCSIFAYCMGFKFGEIKGKLDETL